MSRADEAEKAAIQMMEQRSRVIDQLSELMARTLENVTRKNDQKDAVISDRGKKMSGQETMNKFAIAEKYKETGKTQPKEFINWLLENLPEKYRQILKGTLRHMLEMFSHYDNAQRASERKMHMPWDKDEKTVEAGHYMMQKQAYFEKEIPGVLNVLGIDKTSYMDQEMIIRAHVLEDYIKAVYEEAYRQSEGDLRRPEYADYLQKMQSTLNSIDFGVADSGFKFTMAGEDIEIVIRPKSEVERLARAAGVKDDFSFLIREEAIKKAGVDYYVIDAGNEVYRDIVVHDMFAREKAKQQPKESPHKETEKDEQGSKKGPAENSQRAAAIMNLDNLFQTNGLSR